jgi:magnesium-transporting ATPase (P-type)
MCTGDNIDTATAISKNAGIISEEDVKDKSKKYLCMTGKEFREEVGDKLVEIDDPSDKTGKTKKQGV